MEKAITFIAHGSKKEEANAFLQNLIDEVSAGSAKVNLGFLELAPPSLSEALKVHIERGAQTIRIIPLFLVPGRHLTVDIPAQIEILRTKYPYIHFLLEDIISNNPFFKSLLESLIEQV